MFTEISEIMKEIRKLYTEKLKEATKYDIDSFEIDNIDITDITDLAGDIVWIIAQAVWTDELPATKLVGDLYNDMKGLADAEDLLGVELNLTGLDITLDHHNLLKIIGEGC